MKFSKKEDQEMFCRRLRTLLYRRKLWLSFVSFWGGFFCRRTPHGVQTKFHEVFFIEEYCVAVCDRKYLFEIFYNGRPLRGILWNKAFMRCSQEKKISCRLIKNKILLRISIELDLHKIFMEECPWRVLYRRRLRGTFCRKNPPWSILL